MGNWDPISVDLTGGKDFDPTLFGKNEQRGAYMMDIKDTERHEKAGEGGVTNVSLKFTLQHAASSPYAGKTRMMFIGIDLSKAANKNKLFTVLKAMGVPASVLAQGKVSLAPSSFVGKQIPVFIEPVLNPDGSPKLDEQGRTVFPDVSPVSLEAFATMKVTSVDAKPVAAPVAGATPVAVAAPVATQAPTAAPAALGALGAAVGAVQI